MPDQRQEVTPQEYERIRAMLGNDAEAFKRTKLGQYIMDRAAHHVDQLTKELKRHDPVDTEGIRTLQNEIWKHETFEQWIDDAINSGHAAMQNLLQMEAFTDDENNYVPPGDDGGDYIEPPEIPGD